ncbi:hypothetical protein GCM10007857_61790 [Bradyrhizobium iriomotense]|uniref:Uncharacterized protein n=1 Tax=Bradyrhizobium iriomotense TaxID=441950 RepID=A0ABQ6B9Z0_9BRAD|nr:hypothetical protein GCM10007857_61790 [Bradyrhizobium iriomotense]
MRLVQGGGMDDGRDAAHRGPHEGGIDDRAHLVGELRFLQINPMQRPVKPPQGPENGFSEMACATGDQNCHSRVQRTSRTEPPKGEPVLSGLTLGEIGAGEGARTLDPDLGKAKVDAFPMLSRHYRQLLLIDST